MDPMGMVPGGFSNPWNPIFVNSAEWRGVVWVTEWRIPAISFTLAWSNIIRCGKSMGNLRKIICNWYMFSTYILRIGGYICMNHLNQSFSGCVQLFLTMLHPHKNQTSKEWWHVLSLFDTYSLEVAQASASFGKVSPFYFTHNGGTWVLLPSCKPT